MTVQLIKDWTDASGVTHPAGTTVDVDAATLAVLEAGGYVNTPGGGDPSPDWPGPTAG